MTFRKDTTKDRKMNGSRNTDYVLPAVRMTGPDSTGYSREYRPIRLA
jgi:hypothetical protein